MSSKKLSMNPSDHSDPGPTHRPDGSKISNIAIFD